MKIPTMHFNTRGLRYSRQQLKEMFPEIIHLPVIEQAEYVDQITYMMCHNKKDLENLPLAITKEIYKGLNTTSIGNLAFVSLYHPNAYYRVQAKNFLNQIINYNIN